MRFADLCPITGAGFNPIEKCEMPPVELGIGKECRHQDWEESRLIPTKHAKTFLYLRRTGAPAVKISFTPAVIKLASHFGLLFKTSSHSKKKKNTNLQLPVDSSAQIKFRLFLFTISYNIFYSFFPLCI